MIIYDGAMLFWDAAPSKQKQVIESPSNFVIWVPIATNNAITSLLCGDRSTR